MKKLITLTLALTLCICVARAEVLFTGTHSTGPNWNALRLLPADYPALASLSEGDVLAITMTADATDATVTLQNGDWRTFSGEYRINNAASGVHAFALNAADVDTVAEKGVCVTGANYTISKVEVYYHKAAIWVGSVSDSTGWTQSEQIPGSTFSGLQAGDLIGVGVSAIHNSANWHQFAFYINWRTQLFSGLRSSQGTSVHALTAAEVDSLQNQIVVLAAQHLEITSLHSYEATKSAGQSQSVWTGNKDFGSAWGEWEQIAASAFANAEVGQLLRFKFTDLRAGAQLRVSKSDWNDMPDAEILALSGRYCDFTITAAMLTELQAGGAIISGLGFTLTEVLLINPADLHPLTAWVPVTNNWVFAARPSITVHVENPYSDTIAAQVEVEITTDKAVAVDTLIAQLEISAAGTHDFVFTTDYDLPAGFYKATCIVNDDLARAFGFAVNPTAIVSAPDKQSDYHTFWQTAKAQLDNIAINATLTEIPAKSTAARKVYLVEMQSVPDGLTGEPVIIRGYYCEPQDGQPHPVIMHYPGYDSGYRPGGQDVKPYCPSGDAEPNYAEFLLSPRGQNINNRAANEREPDGKGDFTNTYGDWFAFNFGNKDAYYYRGAYMDCVRAIQFMATRPTSDMNNLYAEGQSQGGAFTYAAASLSGYSFRAIAPAIAFMGDFPDYFELSSWPGYVARENQGTMTDAEMFAFLSYFDTKNLATNISCPVIACIGLQDNVCPPHTNIAPYNNLLSADKEMIFNPENYHQAGATWYTDYMAFFAARYNQSGSAVPMVSNESKAYKMIENGQLFIILNNQKFYTDGTLVR